VKIHKSYKFRLKPTDEQVAVLHQHGGNVRFVWNKLLEFANEQKKLLGKFPNQSVLQKKIIELKSENDFVKQSHSQPIQFNAAKLAKTFHRAFKPEIVSERNFRIAKAKSIKDETKKNKALARALNFGFPKFKSKRDNHDSIFYPQNFKIGKSRVFLAKIGWIDCIIHRSIEGTLKFVTVTQDGYEYYISVTSEIDIVIPEKVPLDQANIVGIDVGLKAFATLSDGTEIKNPKTLKRYLKKIKRESKSLSRKQLVPTGKILFGKEIKKSSSNRDKQLGKLRKIHNKIRNIRRNFIHNVTHDMIAKYDGFILETLDIQGMLENGRNAMNRSILDAAWDEFMRVLSYKSVWNNKHFVKVSQYFPSTQLCSTCGSMMKLSLKDREYVCKHCKAVLGRDLNASVNLLAEGMRLLNESNTVATTEIEACGLSAFAERPKQEKLEQQMPILAFA
jgi:putative transposase